VFGGHGQDYFYDTIAFAISLIPFFFIAALIVASYLEEPLRVRARKIAPDERSLTPVSRLAPRHRGIPRDRAA
jgi:hypothetical protein